MKYPIVAAEHVQYLWPYLDAGETGDVALMTKFVGNGPDLDLREIAAMADRAHDSWERVRGENSPAVLDRLEGHLAVEFNGVLGNLDLEILDDPGFWRWLAVKHFWWFVRWREPNAFASGDWSRIRVFIDGTRNTECVLLRTFLRGRIAADAGDPGLAEAIDQGSDFWRSHIIRVETSYSAALSGALVRRQRDDRLASGPLRDVARRLNRMRSNVVLVSYDDGQADDLLGEIWNAERQGT